jgi:hypothetical protein
MCVLRTIETPSLAVFSYSDSKKKTGQVSYRSGNRAVMGYFGWIDFLVGYELQGSATAASISEGKKTHITQRHRWRLQGETTKEI